MRTTPPHKIVQAVAAAARWPGLPDLAGIIETPTVRPDGTLLVEPGYDARTGLLLIPRGPIDHFPDHPTAADVRAARAALDEIDCDVFYERAVHRSAHLSAMLTLLCRHAIDGPTPMFSYDAPVRSSGKTLRVPRDRLLHWLEQGQALITRRKSA